jgi:hypothetical protein
VPNVFTNCSTREELLGTLAGSASLCWDPRPSGVFDSALASAFVDQAASHLAVIELVPTPLPEPYAIIERTAAGDYDRYLGRLITALSDRQAALADLSQAAI